MPLRLFTVEVRESGTLQLVTAVEILSPVNKQPGHEAHGEYLRKRREMLRSGRICWRSTFCEPGDGRRWSVLCRRPRTMCS